METVQKKISGCQRFWGREARYQKSPVLQLLIKTFPYNIVIVDTVVAQMVKCLPAKLEARGSIPGSGRPLGEGNGNPFQYSCLQNSMDGGDWQATVHEVAKSLTRLSNFTLCICENTQNYTTHRVNPHVNCELQLTNEPHQCKMLVEKTMVRGVRREEYMGTLYYLLTFCKTKTVLKIKVY